MTGQKVTFTVSKCRTLADQMGQYAESMNDAATVASYMSILFTAFALTGVAPEAAVLAAIFGASSAKKTEAVNSLLAAKSKVLAMKSLMSSYNYDFIEARCDYDTMTAGGNSANYPTNIVMLRAHSTGGWVDIS